MSSKYVLRRSLIQEVFFFYVKIRTQVTTKHDILLMRKRKDSRCIILLHFY
nr:MAG TPA: hypothetical protein [Caudoviricetes sp.]